MVKKLFLGDVKVSKHSCQCDFCKETKECFCSPNKIQYPCVNLDDITLAMVAIEPESEWINESWYKVGQLRYVAEKLEPVWIAKSDNFKKEINIFFAICPDCIKQLYKFIKE